MSVELVPSAQLGFHRPLTQLVKRTLMVANTNSQPVAFKVKTTAPKQYCVRPNSGRIEPGERVEVQVLLQPMKEEPAPGTKCRDKFLVQSAIITPDRETRSLQEMWSAVEAEAKAGKDTLVHEQKIRCAFLPPIEEDGNYVGSTPGGAQAGEAALGSVTPSANVSSFTNGGTPSQYDTVRSSHVMMYSNDPSNDTSEDFANGRAESPSPVATDAPSGFTNNMLPALPTTSTEIQAAASNAAATAVTSVSNAATSVSNAASSAAASLGLTGAKNPSMSTYSNEGPIRKSSDTSTLQYELQSARAEIERLKEIIVQKDREASTGLRQRNVGVSDNTSGSIAGAQTSLVMQDGGVPLQVVGAIAAGVFVFTWLFF